LGFLGYCSIKKIGSTKNTQKREKISPPVVPAARENQKTSLCPFHKKGISPKTVEMTVRKIGKAFLKTAL